MLWLYIRKDVCRIENFVLKIGFTHGNWGQ